MNPLKALLILLAFVALTAHAQDVHLSQFYMSPLTLNPALTGMFDGNYRVTGNYRNQWESALGEASFRTYAGSADFSFQSCTNNRLGVGVSYMNDQAGSLDLTHNEVSLSLAYLLALSKERGCFLAAGIQGAWNNSSFDYELINTGNQWNGVPFNPNTPSGIAAIGETKTYYDAGAGLLFYHIKNKRQYQYVGVAGFHLNQPNISFVENSLDRLYAKYVLHAGADFRIAPHFDINPYILAMAQGPDFETDAGGFLRFVLNEGKNNNAISVGPFLRIVGDENNEVGYDAIFLAARLEIWRLTLGFSYDINISGLAPATQGKGAPEFSVQYIGAFSKSSGEFLCPKF